MFQKIKSFFLNYNAGSFKKRGIILLIATILMPLGIACYYQCGLGTDPYSVLVDGHHSLANMSVGTISNIYNVVWMVFMLVCGRKFINVGTILNYLVSGTLIDVFNNMLSHMFPVKTLAVQGIMLAVAVVIYSVGIGLFIVTNLGIGGYEYATILIAEKTKINLKWVRTAFDTVLLLLGIALGLMAGRPLMGNNGLIGIGTIAGVLLTGVIMKWFMNVAGGPLEKWFGPLKKSNKDLAEAVA